MMTLMVVVNTAAWLILITSTEPWIKYRALAVIWIVWVVTHAYLMLTGLTIAEAIFGLAALQCIAMITRSEVENIRRTKGRR